MWVILVWFIVRLGVIFYYCDEVDILRLGDDIGIGVGGKVKKVKGIVLFLAVIVGGG